MALDLETRQQLIETVRRFVNEVCRPNEQLVSETNAIPDRIVQEMRDLYRERRDVMVKGLAGAGWDVPSPEGSMFLWAPIPDRFKHLGSVDFSKLLLAKAKVAVAPGIGFGEHGDGHVRIALVENSQRIRQAMRGIKSFLTADNAGPVEAPNDAFDVDAA